MAAGKYSFIVEQGSTVSLQFDLTDSSGNPVDLTGYHARMQIRRTLDSPTVISSISSSVDADGTGLYLTGLSKDKPLTSGSIGLYISAASSSNFTFSTARYDIELVQGSYVNRFIQGVIRLDKEVTR